MPTPAAALPLPPLGVDGDAGLPPAIAAAEAARGQGVGRSIAWSMGGQLATTFASLGSTAVLARLLAPADFGAFAFAATVYAVVQWLLQVGMGNYLLREGLLTQRKVDGALAIAAVQGLASSGIVLALAPFAGWFSRYPEIGWVTMAVAVVPALCAPEAISDALWLRHGRFRRVALLQFGKSLNQTLVSVACVWWLGWGVFALVAGLLAAALTSFAAAGWSLWREYRARPVLHGEVAGVLRGFGGRTFLLTLAQIMSMRLPDLLVGRLFGVGLLGHWNRATASLDMFSRTTSAAVVRATAPRFYAAVNRGEDRPDATAHYVDTLLFFVWPALAGLAVLAAPVVRLIYGPQWGQAGAILPFLCLAAMLEAARTGYSETFLLRDRLGANAGFEFAHGVYALGLVAVLAPFGLTAVLWGRVADNALTLVLALAAMRAMGGYRAAAWPRLFGLNALLAGAAALPPALLMRQWGWPAGLPAARFVQTVGAGGLGWAVALVAVRHPFLSLGRQWVATRIGERRVRR